MVVRNERILDMRGRVAELGSRVGMANLCTAMVLVYVRLGKERKKEKKTKQGKQAEKRALKGVESATQDVAIK